MSIQKFTLALKDFDFPLVSEMRGISVVIPALDQEKEVPQPMWIENVMPSARGIISVEYSDDLPLSSITDISTIPDIASPDLRNARMQSLLTQDGEVTYYCITPLYHFIYQPNTNRWVAAENPTSLVDSQASTSVFNYKGRTILFHPSLGFFSYTTTAGVFTKVAEVTNGVTTSEFVSATASGAYITASDGKTIYWSSPLSGSVQGDVIEFDPNNLTLTGAGASKSLDLQGKILLLVKAPKGFYIYTEINCIYAAATQVASNPWFFAEVTNTAGGFSYELITYGNNAGIHFNWGDTGLVQVQQTSGTQQFPQVTEFLTGTIWEDYNRITREIVQQVGATFEVKMKFVGGRYLCFSYGKYGQSKEYILVLDITLQRWGKLRIEHLDVYDFIPPKRYLPAGSTFADFQIEDGSNDFSQYLDVPFRNLTEGDYTRDFKAMSIGILKPDFTTSIADFSEQTLQGDGLIIYGGISLTRSRLSQLNNIKLAGIFDPLEIQPEVKTEDTSGTVWNPTFYDEIENDYKTDTVGKEHLLKLEGKFQLSTAVVEVTQLGKM